tara:strand:+ start:2140 stop:2385 length:246 start_codon:yes stop_codon:yes gene_type:complete
MKPSMLDAMKHFADLENRAMRKKSGYYCHRAKIMSEDKSNVELQLDNFKRNGIGKLAAAEIMGITYDELIRKLKRYKIDLK